MSRERSLPSTAVNEQGACWWLARKWHVRHAPYYTNAGISDSSHHCFVHPAEAVRIYNLLSVHLWHQGALFIMQKGTMSAFPSLHGPPSCISLQYLWINLILVSLPIVHKAATILLLGQPQQISETASSHTRRHLLGVESIALFSPILSP